MESNAQKIIKLIVIGAAWAIGVVVPPYITIEPPLQLAIRAIFVVLPVLIYGRKSASSLLKIVLNFCDKCIKMIMEFNFGSSLCGLIGLMLGVFALLISCGICSVWVFLVTVYELIVDNCMKCNEKENCDGANYIEVKSAIDNFDEHNCEK